ncbi:MAG: DNA recombination protein RmuC [Planctomycetota bacterium]
MTALWIILAGVAGLGLGAAIGWLLAGRRAAAVEREAAVATQRAGDLQTRLDAVSADFKAADAALDEARGERDRLAERLAARDDELAAERQRHAAAVTAKDEVEQSHAETRGRLERALAKLEALDVDLQAERERFEKSQAALKDAFTSLSRDALTKNREEFLALASQRFEALQAEAKGDLGERQKAIDAQVKPLREVLEGYQERLKAIEEARTKAYVDVRERLVEVAEAGKRLDQQTGALATALSRPGTRGQWGESTLRRLLELAGMSGRCDFTEQAHVAADDEAGSLRPDAVVHLPGDRNIVIDAKYAADDFLRACEATDANEKRRHLELFAKAVRRQAMQLGTKKYTQRLERTPDFVVMFLPGEALIYAAAEHDPSLLEDAYAEGVIIATPTTLLALLKTVATGWREKEMEDNIEQIKALGGDLADRVAVFATHLGGVGKSLDGAVQTYNEAIRSLESRLLVAARKMRELGTEEKKALPELQPIDAATLKVPESIGA